MARLIAAFALAMLAACAGGHRGPAWPTRSEPETDGGESLAPRTASIVAASETEKATAKPEEKTEVKAEDAKAADKPADAKATITTTPTDEVIIIDDIVIEIED